MAHNYVLRVTAGPEYDPSTHSEVKVNQAEPLSIKSAYASVQLSVRIQNYHGLPRLSPASSPYFSTPPHDHNKDQYSIAFAFTPTTTISADDLVFGNDFDHPIRDRLPPGFGTAMRIVKWGIDPGLDGDPYAEKPYLYGPLGSSINQLWVGDKGASAAGKKEDAGEYGIEVVEGGEGDGEALRSHKSVPNGEAARRKWFLTQSNRQGFEFEEGRMHKCDFFNAYLDFNEFALRLPGFTLPIMKYWDGQGLRYVLKNRKTGDVLFVVLFTLYLKEDVNEDGSIKEGIEGGKKVVHEKVEGNEDKEKHEAEMKSAAVVDTSADDVD